MQSFPDMESIGLALEAGGVGVWSWDIKTDAVTWMGKLADIHGIKTADWNGTFAHFQRVVHSEDQRDERCRDGAAEDHARHRAPAPRQREHQHDRGDKSESDVLLDQQRHDA